MADPRITCREEGLIQALHHGFPLVSRPFAAIGESLGMTEEDVLACLHSMRDKGVIQRIGLVVRHRELGYLANAMVVWQVPMERMAECGQRVIRHDFVSLCYRRTPQPPVWPYNLYCMVHGQQREKVLAQVEHLTQACDMGHLPRQILFSNRRFKQCGAYYGNRQAP